MSGLPGGEPGSSVTNWVVNGWNSAALDILDYQYSVAVPFWKEMDVFAGDHGVKVALEFHPQNLVFNVGDLRRLIEEAGLVNTGIEMDASHLFWQQADPTSVVREAPELVFQAAAKDARVNTDNAALYGVLDNNRFRRVPADAERTNLGGDEWANEWTDPGAWDFVAIGRGHDVNYWAEWLKALHDADPNMLVNIEHEDTSMGREEGIAVAAKALLEARKIAGV